MSSLKVLDNSERKVSPIRETVGPGAYNLQDQFVRKGGVLSYHNDASKRLKIELKTQSKVVGPGTYDNFKPDLVPAYKIDPTKPNSMFAS